MQSVVLAAFFLPYILPVSVVYRIWGWMFDKDFGIAQYLIAPFNDGQRLSVFRTIPLFMPAVAFITVWWLPRLQRAAVHRGPAQHFERNL